MLSPYLAKRKFFQIWHQKLFSSIVPNLEQIIIKNGAREYALELVETLEEIFLLGAIALGSLEMGVTMMTSLAKTVVVHCES